MCHSGSCGKAGSIIDLLMGVRGCDFKKAMQELEQRAGIARPAEKKRHVTGRYEYYDPSGVLQYWKERIEPGSDGRSKEFCFYHGDRQTGRGGEPCLYNLPAVIQSISVFITEGEKQADILNVWGLAATTLDSGSQSKLTATMIEHLAGKHIIILPDNDDPGREYAARIAAALQDRATSLNVLPLPDLPEKGDVVEWAGISGNDRTRLLELVSGADEWEPNPGQPEAHSTNEQKAPAQPINKQPEDLRAFPKMYIDLERLLNDPRRYHFKPGQAVLYDALTLRIAKSPGACFPNIPRAIACELDIDEDNTSPFIKTALQAGLLALDTDGNIVNPIITEAYQAAVETCRRNAEFGKQGGLSRSRNARKAKEK